MSTKNIFEVRVKDLVLPEDVKTCYDNTSLRKALEDMQGARIGSMVIVKDLKPVGIFTERDFLMKIGVKKVDFDTTPISAFMTPNPVCMSMDDTLFAVMQRMKIGRFRHIIITDSNGFLKKMLSVKDVTDFVTDWLTAKQAQSKGL